MADGVRDEAKRKRAGARERRRSLTAEPFEALDEAAGSGGKDGDDSMATMKRAARTAAAAAIAGGLAGAARALSDRRRRSHDDEEDDQPAQTADEESQTPDEPTAEAEPEPEEAEEAEPEAEADRHDRQPTGQDEAEGATDHDDEEPQHGASSSDVAAIVDSARSHVENVLGKEAESISGISKRNGSWSVIVEVVEVQRIPESTDVLGSYEVVLDDDGDLVRIEPRGRHRRSQVEED